MDLKEVKEWLEGGEGEEVLPLQAWDEALPYKFFDGFTVKGMHIDIIEPGRLVCSMKVPPRLINNTGNYLHSGAVASLVDLVGSAVFFSTGSPTTGVSIEINVSYLDAAYVNNTGNYLHIRAVASLVDSVGSAVFFSTEVSIGIIVSSLDAAYVNEELEIEAKVLRIGKRVGVAMVELREKKTGRIIAQGRHAKYLAVSSKL